jgi:hypothetical protein
MLPQREELKEGENQNLTKQNKTVPKLCTMRRIIQSRKFVKR